MNENEIALSARIERLEVLVLGMYDRQHVESISNEIHIEHYEANASQSQTDSIESRVQRITQMIE